MDSLPDIRIATTANVRFTANGCVLATPLRRSRSPATALQRSNDGLGTRSFQSTRFVLRLTDALLIQLNGAKTVADIANVSGERSGGMLVAGLFLREFVPAGVRWAHLDIAGPAYNDGAPYGYIAKGGTGAAVRTLVQIAVDTAEGKLAGGQAEGK